MSKGRDGGVGHDRKYFSICVVINSRGQEKQKEKEGKTKKGLTQTAAACVKKKGGDWGAKAPHYLSKGGGWEGGGYERIWNQESSTSI